MGFEPTRTIRPLELKSNALTTRPSWCCCIHCILQSRTFQSIILLLDFMRPLACRRYRLLTLDVQCLLLHFALIIVVKKDHKFPNLLPLRSTHRGKRRNTRVSTLQSRFKNYFTISHSSSYNM